MAVYRRGYQRYEGPRTGNWERLLVLPRFAWERLMQQRLVAVFFVVAMFWPVACALFVYLSHHLELLRGFGDEMSKVLTINGEFFYVFMNAQSVFAIILSSFAGPSLIAPDVSNGALPLYFSRPMTQTSYVIARMLVLVGVLSPVTWIPGVLLFGMQSGMAGWTWFTDNYRLGLAIFAGFFLWILLVSLVALASSAYVRWRVVAGALVLGIFFILAGAAEMANEVLRVEWASALNPARSMNQIWRAMLGLEAMRGPGAWECAACIGLMVLALAMVLQRKLKPVEVVS